MDVLAEGALDKALLFSENHRWKKTWNTIYEVIGDEYFEQYDVEFPKEFLIEYKKEYNVSHFIPVEIKNDIQQVGLELCLFSNIVKVKRTLVCRIRQLFKK